MASGVSNDFVGERIFRIGSVRYKMDSTKRTLQRISGGLFLISLVLITLGLSFLFFNFFFFSFFLFFFNIYFSYNSLYYFFYCKISCINDSFQFLIVFYVDDKSTCSTSPQPEKDAKKSYIPRRLVIGNDEYVAPFFFCHRHRLLQLLQVNVNVHN